MKKNLFCKGSTKRWSYPLIYNFLLVLFLTPLIQAQSLEKGLPFIANYSPKTYKAFPQTWCIEDDENGLMYFGIQSYILEYDGVRWKKIVIPSAVGTSVVRSMARSKEGLIYYGSFADLGYLDFDNLGQRQPNSLLHLIPAANRDFLDIWSTYSTDDGVYFQAREYIFRVKPVRQGSTEKQMAKVWVPKTKFMFSFFLDNNFYVHQQGMGLYKMVSDSLVLIPGSEFLGKERMQIMLPYKTPSNENQYLIGMFYSGLYLFDGKTFKPFATEADSFLNGTILYKGLLMKNGQYVLAINGEGLVIIDAQGKLLQKINRAVGLQDATAFGVFEDRKGALWLALDNGISRVETGSPFTKFSLQSGINSGVLSILRFDNKIYTGTTNGLLAFNKSTSYFDPVLGMPQGQIYSLASDGSQLLISGDGLFGIKAQKAFTLVPSVSGDLALSSLYILKKYPNVLIAGGTFGAAIFTRTSIQTGDWKFAGYIKGIADEIWSFAENNDGSVWAGSQAGVAFRIKLSFDSNEKVDVGSFTVDKYGPEHNYLNGLGQVYSIGGVNYFVSDTSLYTFSDETKRFLRDTNFGLFTKGGGNTEFGMVEDSRNRVWIRLGKETRLAIPKPEGGYRIDKTQLSSIDDLTILKLYPEQNGVLWICTSDGLIRYDENLEKNIEHEFNTLIRHVSAGNKLLTTDLKANIHPVPVTYKDNTLRFEYAAPFYEQEEKTQYQTWLEGFDPTWSEFDNNYYKEYTNLPAGQYHFHVRAKNVFQQLSEEAVYSFSIFPPWYATWWAYLLYILLAGLLIYSLVRWRTRQLHEKHRELELMVNERTEELKQKVDELAVINSVQEGLARELDMRGIYDLVGEKIRNIFNAQVIDIVTYNKTNNTIEDRYTYEKGDRSLLGPRECRGFRKHVIETLKPLVINKDVEKLRASYGQTVIVGEGAKSLVLVPLITGGEVVGVISLQNLDQEDAFSVSDVNLLTTLANSMSVALENARLFDETNRLLKETEQRTAELAVINSVQEGLARELDMQGIYDLVGERIRLLFDAQAVIIATLELDQRSEHFKYVIENGERFYLNPRPYDKLRQQLVKTKQKIVINTREEAFNWFGQKVLPGTKTMESGVFVPLILGEKITSYISLQNVDKENAFSDSDIRLLETLANSMSVALENARLFDETNRLLKETEQRTAELAVINSVQEGLARELDMQGIYDLIGDRVQKLFKAQAVIIATLDLENKTEHFNYVFENEEKFKLESRPFNTLRQLLIDQKQFVYISTEEQARTKYGLSAIAGTQMPKSLLFVPMLTGNIIKGYVSLQNMDLENAFSHSDIRLLETLANSMSVALENARLFDETSRLLKETEQRTAELAVINSVQDGLAKELDMRGIYNLVGDRLCELFPDSQTLVIRTFEHETGQEHWQYAKEKGVRQYVHPRPFNWNSKQLIVSKKPLDIKEDYIETAKSYGGTGVTAGQPPKSALFVPMIVGDLVKGSISLQNVDREFAFNESDLRLLTTLTNSMSVALENARLFDETNRLLKETEQRTAELAVINSVQEGLARELDMQGIYDLIGDRVQKLFNAQAVIIATLDLENKTEHFNYVFENNERVKLDPRPISKLRQLLVDKKHFIYIASEDQARNEYGVTAIAGTLMPKSLLFVPMLTGNIIKGYVSLQNMDLENAFSHSDIRLLETLANSMSVALENARLFDETNRLLKETEQRTAELAVINSVQDGLAKELDMRGIYNLVGDRLGHLFPDTQTLVIRTFDHETGLEHFQYAVEKGVHLEVTPREYNWANKQLILTHKPLDIQQNYVETAQKFGGSGVTKGEPPRSAVFVPMIVGDVVKGSISLQNVDREYAFNESDLRLLTTLTNSMSVALENARLFDETNRLLKETEQRTAELAVINSVQEGLAKELDMRGIYDLVGDRLCELFPDTQTLVIRTFDHESGIEHFQYAIEKGIRMSVDSQPFIWASRHLIQDRKAIHINENYLETSKKFGGTGVTKGQPPKSAVFVPMLVGDLVKGSISLQNVDRENAFSDSDLRLLTTITNSMSVALENARLFDETNRLLKETEQRTAELAVINSVQDGLVREMDINAIYELVGRRLCDLFDTQTVLIRTFDHAKGMEIWRYVIEKGERHYSEPRPLNWANKHLIQHLKPILINENYLETAKIYGGSGVSMGLPPKSAVFVPMIVGDVVKGSVSLQNVESENAFSESDLRLLTTITNSMSVALENARLFDETTHLLSESKQRAVELSTVNSISKALASQLDPDDLIKLVGDQLKDLFKANIVYLALLNNKTNIIDFPYQFGEVMPSRKIGEGLTSKIIMTGEPLLINKDMEESTAQMGIQHIGLVSASYLGVPIPVGDKIIGVLSVQSTEQENRFNENDLRLLSTIASSVGVALNNATLFEEVKTAKQEAESASLLAEKANEAKSAFLSTVSHELRTPLTSVLGFAKIIKKRLEERIFPATNISDPRTEKAIQQVSDNLNVVVSEGQRLTSLINDVLDLAKIEAGKMQWNQENVSLQEVADRAIAATTSLFDQKSLVLVKDIEDQIPEVIGDKDKLIQVMVNLISNSVKFTPEGTVTCKIYRFEDEVRVSISDTGIGIAPKDHAAVFEQFKQVGDTLTDKPKGTGLGLPICKEIVEHHGGRIWLESELGKGSTFIFALPLKQTNLPKTVQLDDLVKQLKEQVAQSQLNVHGQAANILIVDDDDSIRSLLQQELGDAGYQIDEARNGKEALAKVRDHRPDLILLDIMMPEMNGFDVAAVLKNDPQTMDIPIIVLSIVQDKARGFKIGVDRYLSKPIDTGILFNEIGSLLEQGKSKKKVMIVDEDSGTVNTLTEVLKTKGYLVMDSNGKELVENALAHQPDIIIINAVLSGNQEMVKALRFEKGMEDVLFLLYQ